MSAAGIMFLCYMILITFYNVGRVTGSSEALMIVEALAEVTSHPDDNIAAITFNFWHRLSLALTARYSHTSNALFNRSIQQFTIKSSSCCNKFLYGFF